MQQRESFSFVKETTLDSDGQPTYVRWKILSATDLAQEIEDCGGHENYLSDFNLPRHPDIQRKIIPIDDSHGETGSTHDFLNLLILALGNNFLCNTSVDEFLGDLFHTVYSEGCADGHNIPQK